ncbi:ribosomal methyltransferase [Desulfovibrio sulfodismutans]|uniref:Ribosomal methyltransferase n=1 Tax=Desulfolutivibrio sulfodismutans TaxID=63561 RepID=A0A7K3NPB9_9BACT|nr:small ribosomal subunit Rsm22 family protein [Desulfolutivibrio sulfodismutans]NDY58038.1 ribosomal methyltransferase [Desulfolutivibrio sulfodismutans]QLA11852.1 ribosomal methyltransferase [Desulfolutivibrio sulfodismutans DSM 3696]
MSPRQTGKQGPGGPAATTRPRGDGRVGAQGREGQEGREGRGEKTTRKGRSEKTTREGGSEKTARTGRSESRGRAPEGGRGGKPGKSPAARVPGDRKKPDKAPAAKAPQIVSQAGTILPWTREGRLFPAPGPDAAAALVAYEALLKTVMPLRISHARELPSAIQSLSASLTCERAAGPKPGYLSDPRMLAAYAWYFLPWNLYRLTRLLRGLDLDLPDGATVVDAGSGPLTMVQALWIAAPRLRTRRINFVCLDRSRAALALGREMFLGLAGEETPWRVETVREELPRLPRGVADLVTAANVLNELASRRSQSLSEKTGLMAATLCGALRPGGRLLLVEPGIRASGKLLSRLRENLIEDEEMSLLAPCTHAGACPLAARGTGTWCHFTVDAVGVPPWLEALSKRSGLPKRDVSLSFLFAGDRAANADPALGRVVSNPFPAPGREGEWARYACAAGGLRLYMTPSRGGLVPGDLARTPRLQSPARDKKSGAAIYILQAPQWEEGRGPTAKPAAERPADKEARSDGDARAVRQGREKRPGSRAAKGGAGADRDREAAGSGRGGKASGRRDNPADSDQGRGRPQEHPGRESGNKPRPGTARGKAPAGAPERSKSSRGAARPKKTPRGDSPAKTPSAGRPGGRKSSPSTGRASSRAKDTGRDHDR